MAAALDLFQSVMRASRYYHWGSRILRSVGRPERDLSRLITLLALGCARTTFLSARNEADRFRKSRRPCGGLEYEYKDQIFAP